MDKKFLLPIFFGLLLVICSYGVMAAPTPTFVSPLAHGNYSSSLTFNCSVDTAAGTAISNATTANSETTATLWYGWGAGAHKNSTLRVVNNDSVNQSYFVSTNVDISNLTAYRTYEFICEIKNSTDSINSSALEPIRINNDAPTVTGFNVSGNTHYYNYSGSTLIYLNATIWNSLDSGVGGLANISSVIFNVTNSSGHQNGTYTATNYSTWWNATLDTTDFPDGIYNITVYATDISGNVNSSEIVYSIIFDGGVPSISSFSCSPSSVTYGNSVTCTCTATDDYTAVTTSYTSSPDTTSLGTTTLTCTATDQLSNLASTTTTFSVTAGSVAADTSGTSAVSWTNTIVVNEDDFKEGYTKQVAAKERFKVTAAGGTHHVGVKSVTATSATIEISSDPVTVTLDVGEEAKVDVDEDGIYDIYIKLNNIVSEKADIFIKELSEAVPEGEGAVSTTGEIEETPTEGLSWWTRFINWLKSLFGIGE